jgi:hypothetical protein
MTTPPHSSQHITEAITKIGYKLLSLILPVVPLYHPLTSVFFSPLKEALQRCHLVDDKLKHSTCQAPTYQERVLQDWHMASHTKVEKCVDNKGDFMEK